MRSATRPLQRRPPSPEPLSSNLDSPFPPFPPAKSPAQTRSQSRGGYGRMANNRFAEADSKYAPVSPRTATDGGLMQRMNTIAPGPFDPNGRGRPSESKSDRSHKRQETIGSLRDMTMSSATNEIGASIRRPSTAGPGHSRTSTNSSNGSSSAIPPPRVPRKNGYGGFGPPGTNDPEPLSADSRSHTFPLSSGGQQPSMRRPSEPGPGPRMRRLSNESDRETMDERSTSRSPSRSRGRKQSFSGPDTSRPPPPRAPSLIRSRVDGRLSDAPPVPANINLAAEFGIGNPYHTPSESQSSNASGSSNASKASSTSSPPLSAGPGRSLRQPSDTSKVDVLMADLQSSMAQLNPREVKTSPPRNRQYARGLPSSINPTWLSPESPMDPAIQGGRLSPSPLRNAERPRTAPKNKPVGRPTTAKGNCKGCGEPIKGRSVSSADGRLTGRYHKQCFMCKTCSEPFQTSTFYVINDAPYCEHHYHKLNGSICNTCDRGIEGQYLESERKQKFHPQCLTCADCKRTLRNDYFEMNGRVYCERDAFRRAQQGRFLGPGSAGGGSNKMERRTTRLMMMA
jgi:LIM domain